MLTTTTTTTARPRPSGHGTSLGLAGVRLRPVSPDDHDRVRDFLAALSPEARRARFLQPLPRIGDALVRQLTDVDHDEHVAWVATDGDTVVGEARYVRLRSDRSAAEVAFAVAEGWRRRGLARRLVEAVGLVARLRHLDTFTYWIATDNRASAAFVRSLGGTVALESGLLEGRMPIPAWTGSPDEAYAIAA